MTAQTTDMRRLVLVRHSKASHDALTDIERPLTAKGAALADLLARELRSRLISTDLLLVSPAARARDTARPIRSRLEPARTSVHEEIYTMGATGILDLLAQEGRDARSIVVVGHEPTVSILGHMLHDTDDDIAAQISFGVPTATAVLIDVPTTWPRLEPRSARIREIFTARRR
ncbi:histidine phosphatase family protein [Actinomyces bowdenii]|nr:histidine phosphatase family protein [Actinomyces bowdenii]